MKWLRLIPIFGILTLGLASIILVFVLPIPCLQLGNSPEYSSQLEEWVRDGEVTSNGIKKTVLVYAYKNWMGVTVFTIIILS